MKAPASPKPSLSNTCSKLPTSKDVLPALPTGSHSPSHLHTPKKKLNIHLSIYFPNKSSRPFENSILETHNHYTEKEKKKATPLPPPLLYYFIPTIPRQKILQKARPSNQARTSGTGRKIAPNPLFNDPTQVGIYLQYKYALSKGRKISSAITQHIVRHLDIVLEWLFGYPRGIIGI